MKKKSVINKKAFGRKIKLQREIMNYTQLELADAISVSQNFLGDIERGVKLPSLPTLIKISNTLKISLDSMFSDSLDNILLEPEEKYYTDRQLALIKGMIKTISENF